MKVKILLIFFVSMTYNYSIGQTKIEKQLTNDLNYERNLCVSGNKMVWYQDSASFRNIIYWNGIKKIKLVDKKDLKVDKSYPKISGKYITWAQYDGNDYEIMLYDGSTITQITNNSYDDIRPDLYGNRIVWQATSPNRVYYFNGTSIIKMNSDTIEGYEPRISKNKIAWVASNIRGSGVFAYENGQTKLISEFSDKTKFDYFVSDDQVVWIGDNGTKYDIYTYKTVTNHLNAPYADFSIKGIYNDVILLNVEDASKNSNISLYDGTFNMITNNGNSYASTIYGDTVLYESAGKIYLYTKADGSKAITQNGNDYDPFYKGGVIAWLRDVTVENEVFILADADITAPTLSALSIDGITGTTANAHLTSNEAGTAYFGVLLSSATAPNANQIKAATGFVFAGNSAAVASTPLTKAITGLTSETNYKVYMVVEDASGNMSNVSYSSFSTLDITAPTLSSIAVDGIASTTAIAHLTSSETGTAYYAVLPTNSTPPTNNELKTGTGFIASGNKSVTSGSATDINLTGLSTATTYSFYVIAIDLANNISSVGSTNFSTLTNSINEINNDELLVIHPNPAHGEVKITAKEKTQYKIVNIIGSIVKSGNLLEGSSTIDISNLTKGNYYIQAIINGTSTTKKLIVE